jgi:hypothetical protein
MSADANRDEAIVTLTCLDNDEDDGLGFGTVSWCGVFDHD